MAYLQSDVLNQYLRVASNNRVEARLITGHGCWRFDCKVCGSSYTMAEPYDVAREYTLHGTLDSMVQIFAMEHRHQEKPMWQYDQQKEAEEKDKSAAELQAYKNAAKIKLAQLNALIAQQKAQVAVLESKGAPVMPTPKTEGRRFR